MVRTRVGYAGGKKKNPTYHDLGDHTESFQVDFDPTQTSYAQLLAVFWESHNPCAKAYSQQYRTAIFYQNEAQKKLAEETRDRLAAKKKDGVLTAIEPLTEFYLAEDYHQKYRLRNDGLLLREFQALYPRAIDFVNSTAATRVNAYLDGHGSAAALQTEVERLGLSPAGRKHLTERVKAAER